MESMAPAHAIECCLYRFATLKHHAVLAMLACEDVAMLVFDKIVECGRSYPLPNYAN